jgi:hypothetical protein
MFCQPEHQADNLKKLERDNLKTILTSSADFLPTRRGCIACFLTCCLAASTSVMAESNTSMLDQAFSITNQDGAVLKDAKISSIGADHVLVLSSAGTNKVYFTNLPSGMQAELAGLAAAQRLNNPDRPARSNRRFYYQKLITDLQGKNDEEKIKAFGPVVQTCVDEMKKLNKEMGETEKAGKDAIAAEEKKMQLARQAAAAARDLETSKAEADFTAGKIGAQEKDERLLAIKTEYLTTFEQTEKDFSAAKARVLQNVLSLGKEQRADYDELIKTLKAIQQEQEAVGKRLEPK